MSDEYEYPTKEEQMPIPPLYILDAILDSEPTESPDGPFYKYLGIKIFTPEGGVILFRAPDINNFGEAIGALYWVEKEISLANSFWDTKDFTYTLTPRLQEIVQMVQNKTIQVYQSKQYLSGAN